jgi:hypothetical protein
VGEWVGASIIWVYTGVGLAIHKGSQLPSSTSKSLGPLPLPNDSARLVLGAELAPAGSAVVRAPLTISVVFVVELEEESSFSGSGVVW